jgi:poly(A) polymerase
MRTSDEIYHQVRWDPRFDPARFVLGINRRGAAPERIPMPAFVPGGDIPWHRVLFIEADGELVCASRGPFPTMTCSGNSSVPGPRGTGEKRSVPRPPSRDRMRRWRS